MSPRSDARSVRERAQAPDRPRERLLTFGPEALSDAELVALILRTGARGRDAVEVARHVLAQGGGLARLESLGARELAGVPGIGSAKAAALVAAFELGRRCATSRLPEGAALRDPEDVYRRFAARLRRLPQERFVVVLLDGRHRVIGEELVSQGTLTASLVHPREVFRPALRACAASLILVHNHPSGDPSPSREDRAVTARLARAGELLGIPVLDHVVVAERGYASLREEGGLGGSEAPATGRGEAAEAPKGARVSGR